MGRSPFLPFLLGTLLLGAAVPEQALANIKEEYQRAHTCDYFQAPFVSDVGLYKDQKVRFCISADQSELIYVMAMGTSPSSNYAQRLSDALLAYAPVRVARPCSRTALCASRAPERHSNREALPLSAPRVRQRET